MDRLLRYIDEGDEYDSCASDDTDTLHYHHLLNHDKKNEMGRSAQDVDEDDVFDGESAVQEPQFGLLFDIDGVLARGATPIPAAFDAMKLLTNEKGEFKIPVGFVTNGCNRDSAKAAVIEKWFGVKIDVENQIIHAQTPLKVFKRYHDKFVLILGQGPIEDIARDMGFNNFCTIENVREAYPLLDMVDHANRRKVANGVKPGPRLPVIDAILMFGEPMKWETHLQLLVDLLVTGGEPDHAPSAYPKEHIPILACNMDLVFMAEACMPRYGHGAFLVCLEALWKKITGNELKYTALIGKPSEITYRYAEHTINKTAEKLGIKDPIQRLYFVGDNPEVDIVGVNLYNKYIGRQRRRSSEMIESTGALDIPRLRNEIAVSKSRTVPAEAEFKKQSVQHIDGILVRTGVYKPEQHNAKPTNRGRNHMGHRDFENQPELRKPHVEVENVFEAVKWTFKREKFEQ